MLSIHQNDSYVFQRPLEDLVGELVARPRPPAGQIAHVLQHRVEDHARLLAQLVLVHQLLQQRLLDRLAGVPPEVVRAALARRAEREALAHGALGRRAEVVDGVVLEGVRLLVAEVGAVGLVREEAALVLARVHREEGLWKCKEKRIS